VRYKNRDLITGWGGGGGGGVVGDYLLKLSEPQLQVRMVTRILIYGREEVNCAKLVRPVKPVEAVGVTLAKKKPL